MKIYQKPETANFNITELDMIAIMNPSLPENPNGQRSEGTGGIPSAPKKMV